MKPLNVSEINSLVSEIKPLIIGNHITNVSVVNSTDLLFSFSFYRKEKLLISVNHTSPLLGLVVPKENTPTILGQYNEVFRNFIKDTSIKNIETLNNDRVVMFSLTNTDEFYEKHDRYMVIELLPLHPNILILDENKQILFASKYSQLTDKRLVLKGATYVAPISELAFQGEIRENLKNEIVEYYFSSLETRSKEKYLELGDFIKRKIKSANKKIPVLEKEKSEAKEKLIYQEYGNMLLTLKSDKQETKNYIDSSSVPYDETKSLQDNINALFKAYKKAKSTISNIDEQLEKNSKYIQDLENDYDIYLSGDETKIILLKNKYPKLIKGNKTIIPNKQFPFYFEINGTKFAYGKNSEQNDFLTFKIARDNYHFFHMKDYHGAHVVILKDHPKEEDYAYAAQLAVAASGKDIGEVQYSLVKDIKKGHNAGLVILNKYKSVMVKKIDDLVKQGIKNSSRFSF